MAGTSKDPLDAALERLHALAAQIRDATAKGVNPFAHTGNMKMNTPAPTPAKVGVPSDDADKVIEAPFRLSADDIFERTNEATDEVTYEIEQGGKVLFSTLSRPLAFVWMEGRNSTPTMTTTKDADDKANPDDAPKAEPPSGSDQSPAPSQDHSTGSGPIVTQRKRSVP
jgi:hypothetical protein